VTDLAPPRAGLVLDLGLERGPDGRTRIARRRVAWPWSLPRGFRLGDPVGGPAGCLTILPQAAGAALLPGDAWEQRVTLGPGAAARIVGAGSMLAHGPGPSRSRWRVTVGPGAWFALAPDPVVLFEGAAPDFAVEVEAAEGAFVAIVDGACRADAAARPGGLRSRLTVRRPCGAVLFEDAQAAQADAFERLARLPGAPAAFGSLTIVGAAPLPAGALAFPDAPGVYAACGPLRGGVGITARVAAPDGGTLARVLRRLAAQAMPGFSDRL
jgi:urease accessory protein UreH